MIYYICAIYAVYKYYDTVNDAIKVINYCRGTKLMKKYF